MEGPVEDLKASIKRTLSEIKKMSVVERGAALDLLENEISLLEEEHRAMAVRTYIEWRERQSGGE